MKILSFLPFRSLPRHKRAFTSIASGLALASTLIFGFPALGSAGWIALTKHDGIPVAGKKHGAVHTGVVKRPTVQLTAKQAVFVKKFGQYLKSVGESAVVTSGARSPQHQLSIIKARVHSLGATRKFPELRHATAQRSSTWLRAWEYLRARHVPVNAPSSAGGEASASNHIKGLAVDFIAGSLDHLASLVRSFSRSSFAMLSPLHVTTIAREPGCVHVNLAK
ncbi:MAG TPA: hypothetical protein VGM92_07615 [Candidatus Kapabacteria bacterium]|jgi:hypothetical protein